MTEDYDRLQKLLRISLPETIKFYEYIRKLFFDPKPTMGTILLEASHYEGKGLTPGIIAKGIAEKRRNLISQNKRQEPKQKPEPGLMPKPIPEPKPGPKPGPIPKRTYRHRSKKPIIGNIDKYDDFRYNNDPRDYIGISKPI